MKLHAAAALALKKRTLSSWVVLGLYSSLLAGPFVIQACASGSTTIPISPATAPPQKSASYTENLCVQDANCFKQSIDANHVVLPAGITPEQAYAKYKGCMLQNDQIIGPFVRGGSEANTVGQACFTHALQ